MNNSDFKHLVRSKGMIYANGKGGIVAIIPQDGGLPMYKSDRTVAWLKNFPDVVIPAENHIGRFVGDRVQIFSTLGEYRFWGQVGRIVCIEGRRAQVQVDDDGSCTVPLNETVVIEREGVVALNGMSVEERDAVIAQMAGITAVNTEKAEQYIDCECNDPQCGQRLDYDEWHSLDDIRQPGMYVFSKDCRTLMLNLKRVELISYSDRLYLLRTL